MYCTMLCCLTNGARLVHCSMVGYSGNVGDPDGNPGFQRWVSYLGRSAAPNPESVTTGEALGDEVQGSVHPFAS